MAQARLVVLAGRVGVGHDDRRVGGLVGVEAAAGLAPEQARGDVLLEDRRRRVEAVAALLVHRVEDLVRGVESDQVEQGKRTHRVAATQPHRGIDVLTRGVLGLVHGHRVIEVTEQQRVGDESGLVPDYHRNLVQGLGELRHRLDDLWLGHHSLDDLEETLHGRRVEEVDADGASGLGGCCRDLGDRQRRGVGGQDRLRRHDLIQSPEYLLLKFELLHDGLDNQVAVFDVFQRRSERDPAQQLGLLVVGELAP